MIGSFWQIDHTSFQPGHRHQLCPAAACQIIMQRPRAYYFAMNKFQSTRIGAFNASLHRQALKTCTLTRVWISPSRRCLSQFAMLQGEQAWAFHHANDRFLRPVLDMPLDGVCLYFLSYLLLKSVLKVHNNKLVIITSEEIMSLHSRLSHSLEMSFFMYDFDWEWVQPEQNISCLAVI